jgi:hypothetical protein
MTVFMSALNEPSLVLQSFNSFVGKGLAVWAKPKKHSNINDSFFSEQVVVN